MAASAVLSPVSPGFPSPTLYDLFSRQATLQNDLPHTAVYKAERSQTANMVKPDAEDTSPSPAFSSPSLFQTQFRRMDTVLAQELPHAFEPGSFRRKDTIFFSELPHAAVYDDRRVQKDAPHNHANDDPLHLKGPRVQTEYRFQSIHLTKDKIASLASSTPSILASLTSLSKHAWKVHSPTINIIKHTWNSQNSRPDDLDLDTSDQFLALNLSISYSLTNAGTVSSTLTILTTTSEGQDLLSQHNSESQAVSTTVPSTTSPPFITSEILAATLYALRTPSLQSPFLRDGVVEVISLSSKVPHQDEIVPEGMVWWIPSVANSDIDDSSNSSVNGSDSGSDSEVDDFVKVKSGGPSTDAYEPAIPDDASDTSSVRSQSDIVYELKTALVPDDMPLVEEVYEKLYWKV